MANAVDWITLDNFTPGIYADFHGGVGGAARGSILSNGAAVIDGTYRCCADPSGSLAPLPAAGTGKTSQLIPVDNASIGTQFYPSQFPHTYLMDAVVIGPVGGDFADVGDLVTAEGSGQIDVYTLWQFYYSPFGASAPWRQMFLGRVYHQWRETLDPYHDFMWESTYPNTISNTNIAHYSLMSANLETTRSQDDHTDVPISSLNIYNAVAGVIRRNLPTLRSTGVIPVDEAALSLFTTHVQGSYPSGDGSFLPFQGTFPTPYGFAFVIPSPGNTVSLDSYILEWPQAPQAIFAHQDRTAYLIRDPKPTATQGWSLRDGIYYTAPLDVGGYAYPDGAFATQFASENTATCGVVASVNTDELLLVKHEGGGVLVRGDFDNPTTVRLKYIESTYGISSTPISTPIGLVYGSRKGVYVWGGGETTDKLSAQIDGFFWDHAVGGEPYEGHRGRFGYFDPWVCVPNNYLYDTRGKGWWRLQNPADRAGVPYNTYVADPTSGKMLAFPYKLTDTQNVVYDLYDPAVLASSYSWRSQPLIETQDRLTSFNEISLVASPGSNLAACTVTVTLTGLDANGVAMAPSSATFQFTGTGTGTPVIKHKTASNAFTAQYVQVRIEASAATGAAPKIHSVKLGKSAPRGRNPIDR